MLLLNVDRLSQAATRRVAIAEPIYDYILRLANATRTHARLMLGLSPRGALTLARCAQGHAALRARDFVAPDDVKIVAGAVMAHRLIAFPEARYGRGVEEIVEELLGSVPLEAK